MNLEEVKRRVQEIRDAASDDEIAHGMEDALFQDFILHVTQAGSKSLREMAAGVLETQNIEFSRWRA